jgi:hypothetical protein
MCLKGLAIDQGIYMELKEPNMCRCLDIQAPGSYTIARIIESDYSVVDRHHFASLIYSSSERMKCTSDHDHLKLGSCDFLSKPHPAAE